MARVLAILLAAAFMVGVGFAALLAWVVVDFPGGFEASAPEHPVGFLLPCCVAFLFSVLTVVAVAVGRSWLAWFAYGVQVVAAAVLLAFALEESAHSDGKLVTFALVVELVGLAAVTLATPLRPQHGATSVRP